MANLPASLPPLSSISIKVKKPQHKSMSESGHPLTRAKGTAKKYLITIGWSHLTTTQLGVLETWFDENMGVAFDFTNPESAVTYNVVIWEDEMQVDWRPPSHWTAGITMSER